MRQKLRKKEGVDDLVKLLRALTRLLVALMPLIIVIGKHQGWF